MVESRRKNFPKLYTRRIAMRRFVLLVALWVPLLGLSAQTKNKAKEKDLGYAFVSKGPVTQNELVSLLATCKSGSKKSQRLRVSCQDFMSAINAADPDADVRNVNQLAGYVETLTEMSCPKGRGKLTRYMLPSGKVDNMWERDFRQGEKCLSNANTNSYVLSLTCGNPILSPKALPFVDTPKVEKTKSVIPAVVKDTLFVSARDTIRAFYSAASRKDSLIVLDSGRMDLSSVIVNFKVVKDTTQVPLVVANITIPVEQKKRRWIKPALLGFVTGVGVGVLICELSHRKDKVVYIRNGGPVNPPNGSMGPSLTTSPRIGFVGRLGIRFP
jgi:hypothetical protein